MHLDDKSIKQASALIFIAIVVILSFLIIKPIFISILSGLILAYVFYPIYKRVYYIFREKNTSAIAVCIIVLVIIFIPVWFIVPLVSQQIFDMFNLLQTLDVPAFVQKVIPTASAQLQTDISNTIINFIGKIGSTSFSSVANIILEFPTVLLHIAVVIFVFFFAMRDADKLKEYVLELSPLKKEKEAIFARHFKEITFSIIYGQIIIGVLQGILTGIGLLIFGVPKALLLTILAIFASILPIVGAWLIWVPAAIYLFYIGKTAFAIAFIIYCVAIVSTADNILRPYIVARRTQTSAVVVLVGMIGGLFVFGILGLILGPLILAYLILFLTEYKNKNLAGMFTSE